MPALPDHQRAAERFLALYQVIPGEFPEGRALVLFYAALHLVEMVAAYGGRHNRDHRQREEFIKSAARPMWKHFRPIWEASEQARYMKGGALPYTSAQLHQQLCKRRLRALLAWVETETAIDISRPPSFDE